MNAKISPIQLPQAPSLCFGRYQTVRLLGKGAMGMVYLAHDPVLDRKIALKVISVDPSLDKKTKDDYFQRFSYEAKASAKLNHPSIVPVYDAGEDNGMPWIAFQFIEGETLEKMLKRRDRLPVNRAVAFALDIAEALKHAHGWNIIHRDVKPANILVETLSGIAKLADFGIVKAPWAPATRVGNTLGSPGYMSPEQIEGSDLDQRADIFCLGVVLYQMIGGKHPFLRDTMASTAFATCKGAFAPLSELVDGVDLKLERAIRACLEADKNRRIGSAQQLIDILGSLTPGRRGENGGARAAAPQALPPPVRMINGLRTIAPLFLQSARRASANAARLAALGMKPISSTISALTRQTASAEGPHGLLRHKLPASIRRFFTNSPVTAWICLGGVCMTVFAVALILISGASATLPAPDSPEAQLMAQCETGLADNNRDLALTAAGKLSALNTPFAAAHILIARALMRDGKFEVAAKAIARARNCKGGKSAVKKEISTFLEDAAVQLRKSAAPAALIDLIVSTLGAGNNPQLQMWTTDTNFWLRWNAVKILKTAGAQVDTAAVYILDLAFAGSVQTRLQAVRVLGSIGDKRSISALKKVRDLGQNDPLVSAEASRVLEEKSR